MKSSSSQIRQVSPSLDERMWHRPVDARLRDMSETEIARMLKLPPEERLRLVELLWESLCASPSSVSLSEDHLAAIDRELAEHRRNPDDVLTLEQVLPKLS